MKTHETPPLTVATVTTDAGDDARAARILALAEPPEGARVVALPSGRAVRVDADAGERVVVVGPSGAVELALRFTAGGVALACEGTLDVDCGRLRLRAREGIELATPGPARIEGRAVEVVARRGDVLVRASDDARVEGERVLLNS